MNGVCETQAHIRCEALLDKQNCRMPRSVVKDKAKERKAKHHETAQDVSLHEDKTLTVH